jgi:hypothetical protein
MIPSRTWPQNSEMMPAMPMTTASNQMRNMSNFLSGSHEPAQSDE